MEANPFIGLTAAQLATLQTEWLACLSAIATAHQSYQIAGRSYTRANLPEVTKVLGQIGFAIQATDGTLIRFTRADMSNR